LLGKKELNGPDGKPEVDVTYIDGDIGYRVHGGGHSPEPDWPVFPEFARNHFNQ
jgi:(4-O-methyl)-D-glucuronate---lignin esterase